MLILKHYQDRSLEMLEAFFQRATSSSSSAKRAFVELTERPYRSVPALPGLPYVCLRIPTGGGKTLVAAYAAAAAVKDYLRTDRGVVLWLVPSNIIKDQTLAALRDANHPYRQALEEKLGGGSTSVRDLSEALYIERAVLEGTTCVIVSTLAALRVQDTEGRKVYEASGALQHHFTGLSAELELRLERDANGIVAYSLANVLRLRRPVVVMDEAHNARTPLSFDVLARFSPSCIIEFTATPAAINRPEAGFFASNVLHHVSAAELKAEQMIKLPIRLQLSDNWMQALGDALSTREALEEDSRAEQRETDEYIRPILLVQAQPKSKTRETLTVDAVLLALLRDFRIKESWIKTATGDTKELDGIDLAARDCEVRVILTVQALREGWDCPFAYILCSVAELRSGTAVEQILGRILRMPSAREKRHSALNRAYAFVASRDFAEAAANLQDALVENGFERFEAGLMIDSDRSPSLFSYSSGVPGSAAVALQDAPDTSVLPERLRNKVSYDVAKGTLSFAGVMESHEREALLRCVFAPRDHGAIEALYVASRKPLPVGWLSPAEQGQAFNVPRLAIRVGDQLQIFDDSFFLAEPWKLSEHLAALSETEFSERLPGGEAIDIDITALGRIEQRYVTDLQNQLALLVPPHQWSIPDLANWIDWQVPHPDVTRTESGLFLYRLLTYLVEVRNIPIDRLGKEQFRLRDSIIMKIDALRTEHRKKSFQRLLHMDLGLRLEVQPDFCFSYDSENYPANEWYDGSYTFQKHYYPRVGEMKSEGEEFNCAQFIDRLKELKFWVRNLERQPKASFWLQTSTDRFYPDFVALLEDGRLLVIEYKGEDRISNDDSKEKRAVGEMWAERSSGRAIFKMVSARNLEEIRLAVRAKVT